MAKPVRRGKVRGIQISVAGVRDTFPTACECLDWQARRKLEINAGAKGRGGDVHSLGEATRKFADEIAHKHRSERWERVRIARMVRELPVTLPLSSITPGHLITWRGARSEKVEPASVTREMNLLDTKCRRTLGGEYEDRPLAFA